MSHLKARKSHICDACLLVIDQRERHEVAVYVDGRSMWRWRQHVECAAELAEHDDYGDGWSAGVLGGAYLEDDVLSASYVAWRAARRDRGSEIP